MQKCSILDFFKSQVVKIPCPVCGVSVVKSKLSDHLDALCAVSVPSSKNKTSPLKRGSKSKAKVVASRRASVSATSSKLSLKSQRKELKKPLKAENNRRCNANDSESDDVIVIEEIKPSKNTTDTSEQSTITSNKKAKTLLEKHSSVENSSTESSEKNRSRLLGKPSKRNVSDLEPFEPETDHCLKKDIMLPKRRKSSPLGKNLTSNMNVNSEAFNDVPVLESSLIMTQSEMNTESNLVETELLNDIPPSVVSSYTSDLGEDLLHGTSNSKDTGFDTPMKGSTNCAGSKSDVISPSSDIANIICIAKEAIDNDSLFSELSDGNGEEDQQASQPVKQYAPYYIANFKHILESVLSEEDNQVLFNEEDKSFISSFKSQNDSAQKLYVRLFQRKYKWLRINKINYPEITTNPQDTLEELVDAGLIDSGSSKIELETALNLLSLPEIKLLAKHFNFSSGKNKSEIKQMVLKHCKEHKSVFFMNSSNSIANKILKRVKEIIGPCYRISLLPKRLFTRILMLFSLPTISEDDDEGAGGQQQQLVTLLQVNKGELVFPEYKRTKVTVIFCDRDELIRYEEARQLENDIYNAVEYKNFELAKDLYLSAKDEFDEQCSKSFAERASSLPVFLKRYTSLHVYVRCMTQGVEILQKLRQYKEAVALLRQLLKQKVFCQDYSGRWYDRLALNLEQHLKKPEQALDAIKNGLKNKNVRVGHRYSLLVRALRIMKSMDDDDDLKKQIIKESSVQEAPKVIVKGRLCPRPILGRRHVFISDAAQEEESVTVLGVEQLAIEHYKGEGFSEGIHGEGSTFISLYCLLFWDIIYDGSIPDVFISPYQTHPLDLNSEAFYLNRKQQITTHLKTLQKSTSEDLKEIVKSTWQNHHGKTSLVSWDRFKDLEHVLGLVCCFGSSILCGICERLAKDFRFTRSGVPDLVVWNPETLNVKVVEVKGPGDKLSSKQILWLDYLLTLGADAELCLVEAVGSKKLKRMDF